MAEKVTCCPIEQTVKLIANKWRPIIIYYLLDGKKRFNELRRLLPGISQKILTDNLRALEEAQIVKRTVYPEVPVRVEYELTAIGARIHPIIEAMRCWGEEYNQQ